MRVLHVYSGNLYGGVEALLATLARHRALCPEMEPHYALCFQGRLSLEVSATGAPVYLLGATRVSRPWSVTHARRRLAGVLRRESFDVVVCHAAWSHALFGPVVRTAGIPLAFWLHDAAAGWHWSERWAARTPPDLVLCNSEFTARTLWHLYPGRRGEVIYCPVAPPDARLRTGARDVMRDTVSTPDDAVVVIQVSRMEPHKGHLIHLEALGRLVDLPGWVCWQVGGAQRPGEVRYFQELRRTAARLRIDDRVRFFGQRADVPDLLAAADVHCQPNTRPEPFGIAYVEALLAGLPVVTTALGGALEIIDDTCGLLVAPGDVDALAEALRGLVTDPARRAILGAAGPARGRALCDPATQMRTLYTILADAACEKAR